MKSLPARLFKQALTQVGASLSRNALVNIQASVNYLKIGRWMRDRTFEFPARLADRTEVWRVVADQIANREVLYLEFGVAQGASMIWWSKELKNAKSNLHGFDSFEGLPEEAGPWTKGQFATQGQFPQINDPRVQFHKGWFDQVLPHFEMPAHDLLVVNLDADLYSSTIYVLRWLRPYLKAGTFVYFDEMNHVEHEPRAFDDFTSETGIQFKPVSGDMTLAYVFFQCLGQEMVGAGAGVPA